MTRDQAQQLRTALIARRQTTGQSLRALGQALGVSFSTLARFERGAGEVKLHTLLRLEAWLHATEAPACFCLRCHPPARHTGWHCPGCQRDYAPDIPQCLVCGPASEGGPDAHV